MFVADTILILILFLVPVYGVLIWTYFHPEESILWGRRWMYKDEPEVSDGAIRYTKITSIIALVIVTIILLIISFQLIGG